MISIAIRADARQQTVISPRLQLAVRLLQMSSLDYAQQLDQLLSQNPFLELEESDDRTSPGDVACSITADDSGSDIDKGADEAAHGGLSDANSGSLQERPDADERDGWQDDGLSGRLGNLPGATDGSGGAFDHQPAVDTLASYLHAQLRLLPLELRDMVLAEAIVDSLDEDGYLRLDLTELPEIAGLKPIADADEVRIALRRVQSLEPAGVAARSVAECLSLQMALIECPVQRGLAQRIVSDHLTELAARDISGMSRRLHVSRAEVESACDRIRRFDPRPGWRHGATPTRYLAPDVVVRKIRGQWIAELNPQVVPRLRLNHVYAKMFERHRSVHNSEMAGHLQEARWTLTNVEQRFATILAVAQEIVRRQRQFFEYGPLAMKPLGLRDIADQVGVHESTVSRVTNNKYLQTPLGVFELKYFFSRAMVTASGGACTPTAIRELMKEMIAEEAPSAPLSDAHIARQLAVQGVIVARRTVTKYRQAMKLESVERRRVMLDS